MLTVFACGNYYIPVRTSEAALKETSCEGYFCGTLATCWCAACYFAAQRREMRNKYKIKVGGCFYHCLVYRAGLSLHPSSPHFYHSVSLV